MVKGVVLMRDESGKEVYQTKHIYLRMKDAGKDVELIVEAATIEELNVKLRQLGRTLAPS
jgi:hypothetical protein